jgi:hypothetical protein
VTFCVLMKASLSTHPAHGPQPAAARVALAARGARLLPAQADILKQRTNTKRGPRGSSARSSVKAKHALVPVMMGAAAAQTARKVTPSRDFDILRSLSFDQLHS